MPVAAHAGGRSAVDVGQAEAEGNAASLLGRLPDPLPPSQHSLSVISSPPTPPIGSKCWWLLRLPARISFLNPRHSYPMAASRLPPRCLKWN